MTMGAVSAPASVTAGAARLVTDTGTARTKLSSSPVRVLCFIEILLFDDRLIRKRSPAALAWLLLKTGGLGDRVEILKIQAEMLQSALQIAGLQAGDDLLVIAHVERVVLTVPLVPVELGVGPL